MEKEEGREKKVRAILKEFIVCVIVLGKVLFLQQNIILVIFTID